LLEINMPITTVTCPDCQATLKIPDTIAPGKKIRCPKCKTPFAIPAQEEEAVGVKPAVARPKAASPPKAPPHDQADEEDEIDLPPRRKAPPKREKDDEEDEPRPARKAAQKHDEDEYRPTRKKSKNGKKGQQSPVLLWSLIIGGALVLGGGITLILLLNKGSDKPVNSNRPSAEKKTNPEGTGNQEGGANEEGIRKEQTNLQGTWLVVALEAGGKPIPADGLRRINLHYIFTGNKILIKRVGRPDQENTYQIDPTATPKRIDTKIKGGMTVKGIYELTGDTLKLCVMTDENASTQYPKDFVSRPSPTTDMLTFQREKR
jgi:uncharacterized protein (TIGR03067 family)